MNSIAFETDRLILRQWDATDRSPFAALNSDPAVMEHFPALLDRSASYAMAGRFESAIAERGWGFWAVETKEASQFIGFVGLNIPAAELPFSPCVEIGWRLASLFWGMGFATEAASAALRIGFDVLELPEIVSFTALSNIRSQAVMERLGMKRSPVTFQHPGVPPENPLQEHCLYRLSCDQWKAKIS